MEYTFEKAVAADMDGIMQNVNEVKRTGPTDWDDTYPIREDYEDDLAHGALYVLRLNDGSVAANLTVRSDPADEDAGAISAYDGWTTGERPCIFSRLCVRHDMHSRGLAGEIMRKGFAVAHAQGCDVARLLASEANPTACRVYARLGCREVGRVYLFETWFKAFEMPLEEY